MGQISSGRRNLCSEVQWGMPVNPYSGLKPFTREPRGEAWSR